MNSYHRFLAQKWYVFLTSAKIVLVVVDLVLSMLRKIQLAGLKAAVTDLSMDVLDGIDSITDTLKADDVFLRKVHHLLFEVHVMEGFLVCPDTGRKFPIKDGIPNMLLHEDEV